MWSFDKREEEKELCVYWNPCLFFAVTSLIDHVKNEKNIRSKVPLSFSNDQYSRKIDVTKSRVVEP